MRSLPPLLAAAAVAVATTVAAVAPASAAPGATTPAPAATSSAPPPVAGTYVPVPVFRAVDTRNGTAANPGVRSPLKARAAIAVKIGGHGSVPASSIAAVAVTIHVVSATSWGSITAWRTGQGRPGTTNLVFGTGQNASGFAVVPTSASGAIDLFNGGTSGSVQVIVDVSGYYVGGTATGTPGVLHTLTPTRKVNGLTVSPGEAPPVTLTGAPIPVAPSVVGTVLAAITISSNSRSGTLTAYPYASARPAPETVRFVAGKAVTTFAFLRVSASGRVTLFNSSTAAVKVSIDLSGWTPSGAVRTAAATQPLAGARVLSGGAVTTTRTVNVLGLGGVPKARVSAVLAQLTVSSATRSGSITAWAAGRARPGTNNMLFTAGTSPSNLALIPVSGGGITVGNNAGAPIKVTIDVYGYVPANTITPPTASVSRYLGDLDENLANDEALMDSHGCNDAGAGSFILLDIGAQSVRSPDLSADNPGVALALAERSDSRQDKTVRFDYTDLRSLLTSYLTGIDRCAGTKTITLALGTSNSGSFSGQYSYDASTRGVAWATQVVNPVATKATTTAPHVTVVGAVDIENGNPDTDGFDNVFTNASRWESAYLGNTSAELVFNGAANGCPTTYRVTSGTCQDGWTMAQIRSLAAGSRVQVLPQIFYPEQAVQWANLDAAGTPALNFLGALTEHSLDSTTYTATNGWTALTRALATTRVTPPALLSTGLTSGTASNLAVPRGVPYAWS